MSERTIPTRDKILASLSDHLTDEWIAIATDMIESCPAEILGMVAILRELQESTRDHAYEIACEGFASRSDEAAMRAANYGESMSELVRIWGDE